MRKWFKYAIDFAARGTKRLAIDQTFEQHAQAMGSYAADDAYRSKETFFRKYLYGYHLGRLECYDDFLRKRLDKGENVLSIASGRCANELFLMESGYGITCSDLEIIDAYEQAKRLFPSLNCIKLDILEGPASQTYDAAMCLGLIYLFDDAALLRFFRNVRESLKTEGHLILDSAGSPDNRLSFFIHDVLLKYEVSVRRFVKFVRHGKMLGLVVKHTGYRRTSQDIIEAAGSCGFELAARQDYAFLTEFRRSTIFNKLIRPGSAVERIFGSIGRSVPYIRMFDFKKVPQ